MTINIIRHQHQSSEFEAIINHTSHSIHYLVTNHRLSGTIDHRHQLRLSLQTFEPTVAKKLNALSPFSPNNYV